MKYENLPTGVDCCTMQNEIIKFWKDNNIFERSVDKPGLPEKVFYDGPPFPTGKPHHGTVLVSFIKDMIARYWTMRGYSVPRVWGWDCHGLPIENQAENLLGIKDKNEIENSLGIDKFNDKCYEIVSNNNDAWKEYVEQMARWVDYDNAYKTMNIDYMESVIWAFKTCYEKGLIYKDYRVTPYCTHCETSLSISDTRESDSTRPRQDRWVIVQFKTNIVENGKDVYFLAWTTTPWTLPSNMCLAVGEKLNYSYVDVGDKILVACKNTLDKFKNIFGEKPIIIKECLGSDLVGCEYTPLFNYYADKKKDGAFRVVTADYVGADEGVGIVHTAPAFGEDDYWTCKKYNIPMVNPVDSKGRFTSDIVDFYSENDERTVIEMNSTVIKYLYEKDLAVADGTIEHNYPHCWRCKRPLIYKAMDAYYFNIDKIKNRLIELNEKINWVPETVKHGRFGKWLENARDWNISRNRYWSTPIPIWKCEHCHHQEVLGSIDEIEKASGVRPTNLHRQYLDKITYRCPECGGVMSRVPEVLDCWFESGSVPFAQKHYPFENKEWFENHFPSDFVVEYTGQIRCWFYYLHVLSTALFDRPAYQNCVVHGTILAKDGKKLSKSSKNYTDPMELMKKYGTDAFRLYLYQTKAMLMGDLLFDDAGIADAYQQFILPFWNACNFFISYANIDDYYQDKIVEPVSDNMLDKWMLAKLYETEQKIRTNMDSYQVDKYIEPLASLIDGLTNWFIRRSRRRFWEAGFSKDKKQAYDTLYYVLVNTSKLLAPVAPIISEKIYKVLTNDTSVHLTSWPNIPSKYENEQLISEINIVLDVISLARNIRNKNGVKNRQPLSLLKIAVSNPKYVSVINMFGDIIKEELNVKQLEIVSNIEDIASVKANPNFNVIKSKYPNEMVYIIKAIKSNDYKILGDKVICTINDKECQFDEDILLITYVAKEGLLVASNSSVVVSLDLNITKELKDEGAARDVIRSIQDLRKQIGCAITDKILIDIKGPITKEWEEVICNETLAIKCDIADPCVVIDVQTIVGTINVSVAKMQKA